MEIIKIFALSLVFVLVNTTDIPTIADKAGNIEPFGKFERRISLL